MTEKVYAKLAENDECYLQITNTDGYVNVVEVENSIIIYDTRINRTFLEEKWSKKNMIQIKEEEFNKKYFSIKNKKKETK